jgi:hypothetical protein
MIAVFAVIELHVRQGPKEKQQKVFHIIQEQNFVEGIPENQLKVFQLTHILGIHHHVLHVR